LPLGTLRFAEHDRQDRQDSAIGYFLGFVIYGFKTDIFALNFWGGRGVRRVQHLPSSPQLSGIHWIPLAMTSFFAFAFIGISLCLALFLSKRRWRRGALVLACISCISVPIGTILGALTIYALTRPEVSSEFAIASAG
jgi:zinc transporter ZupT